MKRSGRKSAAQTPAPKKERIIGSSNNPIGSAASKKSGESIKLTDEIISGLKKKVQAYNENHKDKVTLPTLKSVFRRGAGAYSSSHRPTITGGVPNSRSAWAYARVNKFLEKKAGNKVKKAYVQDDDLLERGAILRSSCKRYITENEAVLKTGYYLDLKQLASIVDPYGQIPHNLNHTLITYNSGNQEGLSLIDTINPVSLQNEISKILGLTKSHALVVVGLFIQMGKKLKSISQIEGDDIILIDRDKLVCKSGVDDDLMANGGELKLLAPNGKPSNLNPEQYRLVRTPQFKSWFGDLENDPENASKVVDENGEPLVVYHGSKNKFNQFREDRLIWAAPNKEYISKMNGLLGENIFELFADSKKIMDLSSYGYKYYDQETAYEVLKNHGIEVQEILSRSIGAIFYVYIQEFQDEIKSQLKSLGYDGIKVKAHRNFDFAYAFFDPNQVKLADGTNTTFDAENPDIRYKEGGEMEKEIALPDTFSTYDTLKPILEKQGYELNKMNNMELPVGKLAKGMNLSEVAAVHGLSADALKSELSIGVEKEMEHTDHPEYARAIALDHLYEDPKYYTKLEKMESIDTHYEKISKKYAEGGTIDQIFSFKTPTGEPSKLTYIQQVLVRTSNFKKFFGDWEYAAKSFIRDDRQNFEKHFKGVSKVLNYVTLEPRVVFHGTRIDKEFFDFDVTMQDKQGRPYAYFAHNKEYAQNFTRISQRSTQDAKPFLYECFLNVRNPFMATGQQFADKSRDAEQWETLITGNITWDKYKVIERSQFTEALESTIHGQIHNYLKKVYPDGSKNKFWRLMAADLNKDFKFFLIAYDYDGVFYTEEIATEYNVEDPSQFTYAVTIFDGRQVKLADGRNTTFDPMNADIRYAEGGKIEQNMEMIETPKPMNKLQQLESIMMRGGKIYAEGGKVEGRGVDPNNAKEGGYFKGRSHAEGGIKAINVDTNQPIEVEGGEVVITKKAVSDDTKREFEGKMMTNREILSHINQSGGGVAFAEGGHIDGATCGCSGKKYKYGGEMMEDYNIVHAISKSTNPIQESKKFLSDIMSNIYK